MNTDRWKPIVLGMAGTALLIVLMAGISWSVWARIPADAQVPTHWGIDGKVDGYGSKSMALLVMPFVALGLTALFAVLSLVEPRQENLKKSRTGFLAIWLSLVAFLAVAHTSLALIALGYAVPVTTVALAGIGGLFIVMGLVMPGIRSNFFMGIRTPWTLSSDLAWTKAHQLAGKLFIASGVLVVLGAILLPPVAAFILVIALPMPAAIAPCVQSYFVWRNDPNRET
jgi:uncharacterized membrane protein